MPKFLMCRPDYYGVIYSINPWMDPKNNPADRDKATQQWESLVLALKSLGAEVAVMEGHPDYPDLVFTANAGLAVNNSVLLSNFKYPERQPEKEIYRLWFEANSYSTHDVHPHYSFEGAGDALIPPGKPGIWEGYGFRSHQEVSYAVTQAFNLRTVLLQLVDPHFYHLDTCFCPLNNGDVLYFPKAFSEFHQGIISLFSNRQIVVPEDEARRFACNSVLVGDTVVLPAGNPVTRKLLADHGYNTVEVEMTEFIKAGGACKCLTLAI